MIIVKPIVITPSMLTSNVPEDDYTEYAAGTTYGIGDRVRVAADHAVYQSLQGGNVGHPPSSSPEWWVRAYATNPYRMFDQSVSTASTRDNSIVVTVLPGKWFDHVSVLEILADSVQVKVTDPSAGVVYDRIVNLRSSEGITSWHTWFFSPIERKSFAYFPDIPPFPSASIEITLTRSEGLVSCGVCLIGKGVNAGTTKVGVQVGIQDYSKKERDEWGNVNVVERAYSKTIRFSLIVQNNKVDALARLRADLRATPALYLVSDRFETTAVYGFYREFSITIPYASHSECDLDVEGLI